MGNKSSNPTQIGKDDKCLYCAYPCSKGAVKNQQNVMVCRRCGSPVQRPEKKKETKDKSRGGYAVIDDSKVIQAEVQLPVHRVLIRPFFETMSDADKKLTEQQLLDQYLLPYFRAQKPEIERGARFQIKEIDWRVVACFPPAGCVANETKFTLGKPVSALSQIKRMHVLPSAVSIADMKLDSKAIFQNHIRPYFGGLETRHIAEGEMFVSNGVEFKVIACQPENGIVNQATEIFTEGQPLVDLKRVHMLPIYETLPNCDKTIQPAGIFQKYFEPFLAGRSQLLGRGEEVQIEGVDFKVLTCEPERGLVTLETELFANGQFLRADDLKRQQLEADEAMAREMQQQEGGAIGPRLPMSAVPGGGVVRIQSPEDLRARLQEVLAQMPPNDRHRPVVQRLLQQLTLMQVYGQMNPNFVQFVRAFQNAGGVDHSNGASAQEIEVLPTHTFKPRKQGPKPAGSASPTPASPPPAAVDGKSDGKGNEKKDDTKNDHVFTCRVCLCEYEEGDELRTLPCFHSYHKLCIDKWLQSNKKCPICKNPIS